MSGGSAGSLGLRAHAGRLVLAMIVAALTGAALAALWAARRGDHDVAAVAAAGGAGALLCTAVVLLSLRLADRWSGYAADRRLLELSDPRSPLLKRLASEAPGTYAHSIAMANLCEAACNAIGANGLLARVGCYYHDVGKLGNPHYFAENMMLGRNPHDQLTPEQSAAVIRRHVEDGIALAKEHRVPELVWRFIPEHHGTQEIAFFLERARERGREPDPAAFRYPGPIPQTAETAVALLADAVEAAVRVLDDPGRDRLEDVIEHLIKGRIEAGQLKQAPLTLRQIDDIRYAFVRVLSAMHHTRVAYPEDKGGITADWETADD